MLSRPGRFASTVSLLALLTAGAYGGTHVALMSRAESIVRDAAGPHGKVSIGAIHVEPLSGRIVIRDVQVAHASGLSRIVRVVLHGPSLVVAPPWRSRAHRRGNHFRGPRARATPSHA